MAKSKRTPTSKKGSTLSVPKTEAATLALFRWYVVTIEQVLLEAYATSPQATGDFVEIMRSTITSLADAGRRVKPIDEDGCEPGYERCKDGLCSPMCGL